MSTIIIIFVVMLMMCLATIAGYYLRHLVAFSQKGSLELEVKDMLLKAKQEISNRLFVKAEEKGDKIL